MTERNSRSMNLLTRRLGRRKLAG